MKFTSLLILLLTFTINGPAFSAETESFYAADFLGSDAENIMMDYSSVHVSSEDKTYYECLVWNTKTGNSKLYYYNYSDKVFKAYGDNVQIPANPLINCDNTSPNYFMDYSALFVPSEDKTYYECLVWDSETGASTLYFYNSTDKVFKAYGENVQLPKNSLSKVSGIKDVRMCYTSLHVSSEDKSYYEVLVWDTKSGNSSLYYYSYTDKAFKAYGENVQLPSNPLPNNSNGSPSIFMDYSSVHVPSEDKSYYECLVWDQVSGMSRLYFYDYTSKTFKSYGDNVQMPSNPLGDKAASKQSIFMDYTSIHVPSEDKTYYECLIWDTKTGVSKLFNYNYTSKTFKAYPDNVQLSSNPLSPSGDSFLMMDYTSVHVPSEDKTYYECIVWNPNTGKSMLYFYDYTSKKFKAYGQNVQLPAAPLN